MKKLLTIVSILVFSLLINVCAVFADENIFYGDIDQSDRITVRDALTVLMYSAGTYAMSDEELIRSDVNADGDVNADDARLILLCAAELGVGFRFDEFKANGTLWIAADSIAAGVCRNGGWGQVVGDYLTDEAVVHNNAFSGKTAKAFTETRNYKEIVNNMKSGDTWIICFGHNEASMLEGTTSPEGSSDDPYCYKYWLKHYYIDVALRRGVQPILMNSVARAWGPMNDFDDQYHYRWTQAAKELVAEYKEQGIDIPFIDMFQITTNEYLHMGKKAALAAYHNGNDTVHYREEGARFCAQIILCEIKELGYGYADYINEEALKDPRKYDGIIYTPKNDSENDSEYEEDFEDGYIPQNL